MSVPSDEVWKPADADRRRAREVVNYIVDNKRGAWGGVLLQVDWMVGIVASALRSAREERDLEWMTLLGTTCLSTLKIEEHVATVKRVAREEGRREGLKESATRFANITRQLQQALERGGERFATRDMIVMTKAMDSELRTLADAPRGEG